MIDKIPQPGPFSPGEFIKPGILKQFVILQFLAEFPKHLVYDFGLLSHFRAGRHGSADHLH
ncbi:hypothetical protein C6A37_07165 [Desulfobacteraceae bacterium SEEP-SAG9]|nr:hypothetical protein C6A37_07165 [Desulfobacteraceae bacterium SEEP-SAG9]